MKIFRKFLVSVMSFGMICTSTFAINPTLAEWDDEVFRVIASHTPKNLDECCLALDDALRNKEEIKEKIKNSSDDVRTSYIMLISNTNRHIGYTIAEHWLYLPDETSKSSSLAELFYAHGADFYGEDSNVMVHIIFENYRYYLNNGKSKECSIEDLAIDHWFNYQRCFTPDYKREELEQRMRRWPEVKAARYNSSNKICLLL